MKRRMSFLPVTAVMTLMMVFPWQSAYAHHESWLGSAFWHNTVHALADGAPVLMLAAVVLATLWYRRRAVR